MFLVADRENVSLSVFCFMGIIYRQKVNTFYGRNKTDRRYL